MKSDLLTIWTPFGVPVVPVSGLRGTGMLPFADLPEEDRWALVSYVRSLSPIFAEREMAGPLQLAEAPDDIDGALTQ